MLKLYTNVITGKTYDENGDLFEDGLPVIFYKTTATVRWQLCSETPDLVEGSDDTPETAWTKCTDYAQYQAVGAFLTADDDYIKRRQGTLSAAVSAGSVSTIEATVSDADFDTIPSTGVIELFDSDGESEVVKYNARNIEDGVVTFTLATGSTVERSYESGSLMDCSDEPLMQASLDTLTSDVASGLFAFKIRAFSRKLHDLVAYSNSKVVDVMGLELAIFRIDSDTNAVVDLERFEVDTFQIRTGMAETSANPPLTDDEANETVTLCNTLLAAGFSLQFSADGSSWHDTQVTSGENLDVYFRFRSAGSGGTWSNGIRLVKGDKGDDGASAFCYVSFASDDEGSDFSLGEPAASSQYVAFLATDTEIETPSATDFAGLWSLYKGPQGDPGTPGTNGTRGTKTYFGTKITGTSTTAAVFDTDIADALIGDCYINTSTLNLYECTLGGADTVAKWKYVNTLKGTPGIAKYQYIAYASNNSGSGFSMTPSDSLGYIAFKNSDTEITNPSASDFTGLWTKFHGNDGTSSYTYVAYASSSSGSGFSLTPSDSLKYRAEIHTTTPISSPSSSDFSGATWVKYLGDPGSNGTRGSRINYGTAITGTSTTPTSYATGISDSLVGDQYINSDTMNLYRCTTAGNASTAKWIYVGAMKGEAEAALEGVKLNGELLTPTDKVVDVNALPVVTTLPALADTTQDILLYKGEDDATANPPLVRGHTYSREGSWSDSTITVIIGNTTKVLSKVGSENKWTDNGQASWEDYALLWAGTSIGPWEFVNGGSPSFYSPSCESTTMPWDPVVSGKQWDDHDGGTPVVVVKRSFNGSWVDLTAKGDEDGTFPLPYAKTMPTANAQAKDFVLFLGTTDASHTKGHLYEKTMTMASTLTVTMNGSTKTLNKQSGNSWQDTSGDYSLYYSSTRWYYNSDGWTWKSPTCPNTTMPWELNGQNWTDSDDYGVVVTVSDPTSYSWTDLGSILGA